MRSLVISPLSFDLMKAQVASKLIEVLIICAVFTHSTWILDGRKCTSIILV